MNPRTSFFSQVLIISSLAALSATAQSTYEPYTFTTLAGSLSSGATNGTGTAARFFNPQGVAVDSSGNIYVADTQNFAIRKITPQGVVSTFAGAALIPGNVDALGNQARFYFVTDLAVDTADNLYVADEGNHTIRKITPAGLVSTLAGDGRNGSKDGTGAEAEFRYPYGVAVDRDGNVYVADLWNVDNSQGGTIRKITPGGVVSTLAGSATNPPGKVDGTGSGARFSNATTDVAVDGSGNVYVADAGNFTIRKVTPAGVVTTLAGLAGTPGSADGSGTSARFFGPQGLAIDGVGNVYLTDYNRTIRKITPAGVVTTLAGTPPANQFGGPGGSADGTGSAAQFNYPFGLAVDKFGTLYVADTRNNTIRKGYAGYPPLTLYNPTSGPRSNSHQFGFNFSASSPQSTVTAVIEASVDLSTWLPVQTNTFTGTLSFADPQSDPNSRRFYRARVP